MKERRNTLVQWANSDREYKNRPVRPLVPEVLKMRYSSR
jgi:hypothetical protein